MASLQHILIEREKIETQECEHVINYLLIASSFIDENLE